ncbi:hypothetical protein [Streptomyces coffeae]|uniref:Uncharacterized protein n=1 Tax=Streptomyces coffeae TaxID=621382 RepID=A0ABS1NKW0_9ACTN|nr:hypothetical protein [Streptomyces coffeae]MBL1100681.1 hypothetical protein [Streptomyces coffeae]
MTDERRRPEPEGDAAARESHGAGGPLLPLPGRSTEYEVYLFRCGVCGEESTMMFMDAGETPLCGRDPDHGATTWVR